jgi:SAM-dependent methyltransferase
VTARALRILRLGLREAVMPANLARTPEPSAEMNAPESVEGFAREVAAILLPVYEFNARAIDALAPGGAHVLDLGSGSGQFLAYLAARRPDLRITGLEYAEDMIRAGRKALAAAEVEDRVRLVQGDMRAFRDAVPGRIDLVSSIFALHHLTARDDLASCLAAVAEALGGGPARLWVFDHARPRRRRTAEEFPEIFTPRASPAFRRDSCNSLQASWSFAELQAALRAALPGPLRGARARLLPLYQIHWLGTPGDGAPAWLPAELPRQARAEAAALARLFPSAPRRTPQS